LPTEAYRDLLDTLDREFTYTFGGCTTIRGLDGSYLSQGGSKLQDRITLIYADAPHSFTQTLPLIAAYADKLRDAAFIALEEEAVLVAVYQVYHSI
jgi:hypothetical protein